MGAGQSRFFTRNTDYQAKKLACFSLTADEQIIQDQLHALIKNKKPQTAIEQIKATVFYYGVKSLVHILDNEALDSPLILLCQENSELQRFFKKQLQYIVLNRHYFRYSIVSGIPTINLLMLIGYELELRGESTFCTEKTELLYFKLFRLGAFHIFFPYVKKTLSELITEHENFLQCVPIDFAIENFHKITEPKLKFLIEITDKISEIYGKPGYLLLAFEYWVLSKMYQYAAKCFQEQGDLENAELYKKIYLELIQKTSDIFAIVVQTDELIAGLEYDAGQAFMNNIFLGRNWLEIFFELFGTELLTYLTGHPPTQPPKNLNDLARFFQNENFDIPRKTESPKVSFAM